MLKMARDCVCGGGRGRCRLQSVDLKLAIRIRVGYNGEFVFFESMVLVFLFLNILSYNFTLNQPDIDFFSIHFQVHLSFLFVGHTHEDVDAAFSQIAKTLRQQDVETFDDLVSILPNGKHLGLMYDGKGWMYPHLVDPQHHTQPLHYRFQAINDKDVKVHYKGLFNHPWEEYESGFFKSYMNGKKYLPSGEPNQLTPNLDRIEIDRLTKQIKAIAHLFSKTDHTEWWNSFLETLSRKQSSKRGQWYLKLLPRQKKEEQTD